MSFLLVLVCTLIVVIALKDVIRKFPVVLYAIALVLSVLYVATSYVVFPHWLKMLLFLLMQKGTLATALFVVVMYMGVFRDVDFVKHRLMPIRATLSIAACVLILGHVTKYLLAFLPVFGSSTASIQCGLVISLVCFALMLVLGITSLQCVKHLMGATAWVKLQKWAYLFYALVYVHLVILLGPSALGAGSTAASSIIVYTAVFGLYAVLRIGKALKDRKSIPADDETAAN